jgi:quercetin dioxygenase-like cupin family protein
MRGIILGPGEGVSVPNPVGGKLTFKIGSADTDGALTAFETIAAPGEGPPLHIHVNDDEIFYALEGSFRFKLDGELLDARAGTLAFIPKGVAHTWQNIGDEPARLLIVTAPAGFERFFELFAQIPADASPAEEFRRIGEEIGMTVAGAPLAESDPL